MILTLPTTSNKSEAVDVIKWPEAIKTISVSSSLDETEQKAYFLASEEEAPLIVSLHQWSATYDRFDPLSEMAYEKGWNYIRPNFRGANNNPEAGGSELAIRDIDDAISFAKLNSSIDSQSIHIVGASGGGHAALMHLMTGFQNVSSYSVWVPIVDLVAWYGESVLRGTGYDKDIMAITESANNLNVNEARNRSPLYQEVPVDRINNTEINIFAGVNDGYDGSVPISHSINFYNKLIDELNYSPAHRVPTDIKSQLLYTQNLYDKQPDKNLGNRSIIYKNSVDNLSLTIFDGNHEILYQEAFDIILTFIQKNHLN